MQEEREGKEGGMKGGGTVPAEAADGAASRMCS